MITRETLNNCLEQCKLFWITGDVKYLHYLDNLLNACGVDFEGDEDCVRDILHICVRRKLDVQQAVDMLVMARFEVEAVNNG